MVQKVIQFLKSILKPEQKRRLKRIYENIASFFYPHDLVKLATIFGTDKWNAHWYARHYQTHFQKIREQQLRILEIGVGGGDDPRHGGASLRMWKRFFPESLIFALDIFDKSPLQEKRIRIFKGSQADASFLKRVHDEAGPFDIIIDDGSHINEHVLTSFHTLFPLLKDGGIYVAEDLQTSYWPVYGGDSVNLNQPRTSIGFFKSLVDGLNQAEWEGAAVNPGYYAKNIVGIHFYHNMVFIYKGANDELSYGNRHAL